MSKERIFTPHGNHLIAGNWVAGEQKFASNPTTGDSFDFSIGTPQEIDRAVQAAEDAFWSYGYSSADQRAEFLNTIADEIELRGAAITEIGVCETGLPEGRLQGECGRTTGQLRLFAQHILAGSHLDKRHDVGLPDRAPLPRPDIKMLQRPIGPVAVFGASNFPLAFSTAGGDTAAALAAGCPVVVKGHSAHPGTGEVVAEAIHAAIQKCGLPAGVFSLIQGGTREVGAALVQHPLINAVGFTGSLAGGKALFDLCAQRPNPIPFFGELGSVNPMFMMPHAMAARGSDLAKAWAGSLTMGAGQFCTNPGVAVVIAGADADRFTTSATEALATSSAQVMLTDGIAAAYRQGCDRMAGTQAVQALLSTECDIRQATPYLFRTTGENWLANHALGEEVFGPLGLIVEVQDQEELFAIAKSLDGQLTCSLHMEDADTELGKRLMPILERKAGRVLANGFPTGVEVCDAMVHGGPFPASTNFGHTSVGTLSIRRFLRPVSYQNIPDALLPEGWI